MKDVVSDLQQELTGFFSAETRYISWPYPMYRRWQERGAAIRWEGGTAVVVTAYRDVKAIMSGAHPIGNNAYRHGGMAERILSELPASLRPAFFEVLDFESLFMSRQGGDVHRRLRRVASRAFTPRRIDMLRSSIEAHVSELLEPLLQAGGGDYKREVANRLPVRVIADLIGIPQSDRQMIWEWSEAIAAMFSLDASSLARAHRALADFRLYVGETIASARRRGPGSDLARDLLAGPADASMTEDELMATYLLLLFGGTETTTNLLGNGFLALQRNRPQWEALVRDPGLMPNAIEEVLRYDSPHQYLPRYATADCQIAGVDVRRGETVIIVQAAANRDPAAFQRPDELDIRRANAREHLSFAFGLHVCLGAALARLEGSIVFGSLVRRIPDVRLVDDDISYGSSAMLRAIASLAVETGPVQE